jgi:glycine cleavage system T protein
MPWKGVDQVQGSTSSGQFVFEPPATEPVGSVLYDEHLKLTSKLRMSPFAGYVMPLWYSSIAAEHEAVRSAAGLFDCTHMGVLEVSGGDAEAFLNTVATNNVSRLKAGRAQYSYILDAAGNVLDDIIIYRQGDASFMVVVNAANEPKIKTYFRALLEGQAVVDIADPGRKLELAPTIRDLRDSAAGSDGRVDLALQGPASIEVLAKLVGDASMREQLSDLKSFALLDGRLGGIDCLISTTGYTGASISFELFVHPKQAAPLWNAVLEAGASLGVLPCGLGARDSLRIEAGLPLYGHELAGPFGISPFEAGYGWAVKLDKEFFIGQAEMARVAPSYDMQVARLELSATKGVRPVRPEDPILDGQGACIGWILSSAKAGENQYALVYMARTAVQEGNVVGVYYLARSASQVQQGRYERMDKGQEAKADLAGTVVGRFEKF